MKTIGLLGGMSWESSALYYRVINEETRLRLGGSHSARIVLTSLDFDEVESLQEAGDWDGAAALLGDAAVGLCAAGAELLVICTNTMHRVAGQVAERSGLPLIHIADVTGAAIRQDGLRRVGLLGTSYTMEEGGFYRGLLEVDHELEVVVPGESERDIVNRIIFDELVRGVIDPDSRRRYLEVIAGLVDRGAEGIVLGCTEIELLVRPADVPIPVYATTRLHALAAVDAALGDG